MYNKQIEVLDGADIVQALTCPEGYLPCDGSIYNRDDFPVLGKICDDALIVTETVPEGSMVMPAGITEEEFRTVLAEMNSYSYSGFTLLGTRLFAPYTLGRILYSDDYGTTWHISQLPNITDNLLRYQVEKNQCFGWDGNVTVIFTGEGNYVFTSKDMGTTWTRITMSQQLCHFPTKIYSKNLFSIYPSSFNQSRTSAFYWTSSDGLTWTERPLPDNSNFSVVSTPFYNIVINVKTSRMYYDWGNALSEYDSFINSDLIGTMLKGTNVDGVFVNANGTTGFIVTQNKNKISFNSNNYSLNYNSEYDSEIIRSKLVLLPLVYTKFDYVDEEDIEYFNAFMRGEMIRSNVFIDLIGDKYRFIKFPIQYLSDNTETNIYYETATGISFTPKDRLPVNVQTLSLHKSDCLVTWLLNENRNWSWSARIGNSHFDETKFVTPSLFPENGLNFYIKAV